eukprot:1510526-Rhodomonas_salina.1
MLGRSLVLLSTDSDDWNASVGDGWNRIISEDWSRSKRVSTDQRIDDCLHLAVLAHLHPHRPTSASSGPFHPHNTPSSRKTQTLRLPALRYA